MQTAAQPPAAPGTAPDDKATVSGIAWQFAVQYYTHMNDKPELLHRFYTKKSHYLHGVEGEETPVLMGQAAIHKKFLDIKFKECKVFIHSVDAQPSANNGIFVHVIGEMTNNGEPWRKFVQAFFLAEQTNGYYVLNDNFRYLKEEEFADDEEEEGEDQQEQLPASDHQPGYTNGFHPPPINITHVQPVPAASPVPVPAPVEVPAPAPVEESVPEHPREPTPEPVEPPAPIIPDVIEPEPEPEPTPPAAPSPVPVTRKTPSPAPSPSIELTQPTASTSAPPPAAAHQPAAPVPAPAPAAPAAPKTWASLAATNSSKWGQNVAQEVKGVSTSVAQPPAPVPSSQPRERPVAASTSGGDPTLQPGGVGPKNIPSAQQHPNYASALAVTTPSCFVKGVTENVTQQALEQLLTQRFGPLKECEIVRSRACAFVEFRSVDSAKKAIIASLHAQQGGEGGIKIDEEKYGPNRIIVETRKERGDRPPPKQRPGEGRGGAPGGYGQGGNQGYSQGSGGQGFARGRGTGTRGRGDGGRGGKA